MIVAYFVNFLFYFVIFKYRFFCIVSLSLLVGFYIVIFILFMFVTLRGSINITITIIETSVSGVKENSKAK